MFEQDFSLNRRSFLGATATAAAVGAVATGLTGLASQQARAAVPAAGTPMAGAVRYKVGDFEVTALLDGYLDVTPEVVVGYDAEEGSRLRERAFVTGEALRLPVNAYLVNTGDKLVLIDAGTSTSLGPTMGKLPQALAAAGVTPDQVDAVLITHMHPDHLFGVLDGDGNKVFANAELLLPEIDRSFWFDDANLNGAPEQFKPFFLGARKAAGAYADRQSLFAADQEVLPGIRSLALPGHTPGHSGFVLDNGGDTLVVAGDVLHMAAYQFARPDWAIGFDIDPVQAAATRKAFFDRAASERLLFAGAHVPFPSLGHVARDGDAYAFVPADWPYAY